MSYSIRAEGILPKYLYYLKDKNAVEDNKIEKALARKIFMEEFKPQYNIVKFPFSQLFRIMWREFKLFLYDRTNPGLIHFKKDKFDYLIRYYTKSDLERASNLHGKSQNRHGTTSRCNICNEQFSNATSLRAHECSEEHLRKKSDLQNHDVVFEIVDGHGTAPEIILLRQQENKNVNLKVCNNSEHAYVISEIIQQNPCDSISLKTLDSLPPNSKKNMEMNVMFKDSIFYVYILQFRIKNMVTGKHSDIFKEIMFQVNSQLLDDLGPITPFQPKLKQLIRKCEYEIDPGELPAYEYASKFVPALKLQKYPLPHQMVVLFDNNIEPLPNMTAEEKHVLLQTKRLIAQYAKLRTLDCKIYFSMNQLRLQAEEYQMNIDIHSYNVEDQVLLNVKNRAKNILELSVPGLSEHRPSILRGDSVFVQENKDSTVKYEGKVHSIKQNSVILGFSHRFAQNVHIKNKKYLVSFTFNRVPLRAEHQANELIKKHAAVQFFCPEKIIPNQIIFNEFIWYNKDIQNNEKQQEAIRHIVSATASPAPYLIFGPPGTGKTVTVVESVLQIRKLKSEQNILVSTPSNYAADEITKRLIKHISKMELIRYIAPSHPHENIDETIKPYTNFNNEFYHPANSELLKYKIVVTTLITASRLVNGGTPAKHFSYVFIDESGQATETETLVPIAGILTNGQSSEMHGQIVLAGDPQQLGPIIHSNIAINIGFGISMLERLMTHSTLYKKNKGNYNSNFLTKLLNNYRSHPAILEPPNKLFYEGELIPPVNNELVNIALRWDELPNKQIPLIFHSVMGKDEREATSPSFFNLQEIDIVVRYLDKLIGNRLNGMKIEENHIGVITPYRQQVYKLQSVCKKQKWSKLSIGSVEKFQGQERLIIIVSTVRSDPKYSAKDAKFHLGFLRNPKRMNVAITRAKALLIVIGNPNLLQLDKYWRSFIKYCKDNEAVVGTPFEILDSDETEDRLPVRNGETSTKVNEEDANFSRGNV